MVSAIIEECLVDIGDVASFHCVRLRIPIASCSAVVAAIVGWLGSASFPGDSLIGKAREGFVEPEFLPEAVLALRDLIVPQLLSSFLHTSLAVLWWRILGPCWLNVFSPSVFRYLGGLHRGDLDGRDRSSQGDEGVEFHFYRVVFCFIISGPRSA